MEANLSERYIKIEFNFKLLVLCYNNFFTIFLYDKELFKEQFTETDRTVNKSLKKKLAYYKLFRFFFFIFQVQKPE